MGISRCKLEVVSDPASKPAEENGAPRTSMVRDREPEADLERDRERERETVPPPSLGVTPRPPEPSATTQIGAWQVVADLLANVQRGVGALAEKSERHRLESQIRPLARAVTQWQTVAPHAAQSKIVLERLLEIQDELSELKTG